MIGTVLIGLFLLALVAGMPLATGLGVASIAVLAMGLYPRPFTDVMDTSVAELLKHVAQTKLN